MSEPSPLEKRLTAQHSRGCTIHRWSDLDKRACSCGRDEAILQLGFILRLLMMTLSRYE